MKFRILPMFATVLFTASSLLAATSGENPYTPIVTRNIFGLVPIPVVDPASLVPAIPPPKITPNGIMTIFGKVQALFKVAGVVKPGQPPKDESYVLGEGERQDDIEVQKIDEASATITFNNHGTIQALPLVAGKASGGGPAPAAPGGPMTAPMPAVTPSPAGAAPTTVGFGGRFGRSRAAGNTDASANGGAPGFGGAGNSGGNAAAANSTPVSTMSPEEQVIMIEAKKLNYQQQGDPVSKIFPHTELTPLINAENNGESPSGESPPQ